jgi:predicted dehydrogenase
MRKKSIRSGIIGSGYAASFHFEAMQKAHSAAIEVVGAHSLAGPQLDTWCEEREIKAFHELEPLLDQVDVVHVCAIPVAHEELTIEALKRDKFVIVEKPLTGYFGDGSEDFNGDTFPKEIALKEGVASAKRMVEAERASKGCILYAENWVYTPAVQKEREIVEKTGCQILWIYGEQGHSGSTAPSYGHWKDSGGGVMLSKGCHPLSVALYLKQKEGMARDGKPIRPKAVTSRVHALTRLPNFRDEGHIRANYHDIDDFSMMHITFEDGTIADIVASDIILGGVHNWVQVCTNNHRSICNLNPNDALQTYNPSEENFKDIYTVEKIGTKAGWTSTSPDEGWFNGYQQEMEAFYQTAVNGAPVESNSALAADCTAIIYAAYVSDERKGAEVEIELV